uniref:Uncharacterized protein n=1 Tax=Globisporangium ultimum (strain ATCC 200006 / CBS 805.95 / DAOM BR144) TaxID=431595 RepID=K3X0B6_GLOUD
MNKRFAFDNRLCYERTVAHHHLLHQQKLQTILPTALSPSKVYLDSNAPPKQPHLGTNAKRKQLEKEKQSEIELQNERLAYKMEQILHRQENALLAVSSSYGITHPRSPHITGGGANSDAPILYTHPIPPSPIAQSKECTSPTEEQMQRIATPMPPKTRLLSPKKSRHSPARLHMPGIRPDATQTPLVDCYLSPEVTIGRGAACNKRTLINRGVQKRHEERIADENRRMKARVQMQKPFYNTKQWDADWQKMGQRFSHLRQNGTVGYLLPPPKTSTGTSRPLAAASPRAPRSQEKPRTSHGLPHLRSHDGDGNVTSSPPASNRTARMQQQISIGSRSNSKQKPSSMTTTSQPRRSPAHDGQGDSTVANDYDSSGVRVVELSPCVFLEATTRKGVHLHVEELQVEVVRTKLLVSERDLGDRGLVIRGLWAENVRGYHHVGMDTLQRIAQETEDLEIMIKLETVACIPQFGANFPRLSNLLTEEELETLLVRLVQRVHIELVEDQNDLRISMRLPRIPSDRNKHDASNEDGTVGQRLPRRPRSCPSTMSSSTMARTHEWMWPSQGGSCTTTDPGDDEVKLQYQKSQQQQFGSLFIIGKTRYGLRLNGGYYLVRFFFTPSPPKLTLQTIRTGKQNDTHVRVRVVPYSPQHVEALLFQLEADKISREEFVIYEICKVLQ